ncbi:MAG: SDR family NAD(P)-dependent oxidoreductase [Anaerolineales bacterium]
MTTRDDGRWTANMEQKVIFVNGAGRGLGRTLAEAFARQGAAVAINDLSPITLDWAQGLEAQGCTLRTYTEDPTRKIVAQALVKQVEDEWGRIDVLVHHAAVAPSARLLDMDEWDWHRSLDLNLTAAFLLIQSVGRIMRQQGGGLILLLLSPEETHPAFFIAQMGLWGLTLQARRELTPYGIRVEMLSQSAFPELETPPSPTLFVEHALNLVGM